MNFVTLRSEWIIFDNMDEFKNNIRYQNIIKTAHELFWKFGIKRVTIEEVCKEAGVSKMTFYRFFPNKTELAKTVIENLFNEGLQKYRNLMSEDIPFAEKVKKQILIKFEGTEEISPELVKDIYGGNITGLKEFWENKSGNILKEVMNDYREAQKNGWIRKEVNIEFIQYYIARLSEFISDEKAISLFSNVQNMIMDITNLFFYGILPHEEKTHE